MGVGLNRKNGITFAGCVSVNWDGKQNKTSKCQFFISGRESGTYFMVQKMFIHIIALAISFIFYLISLILLRIMTCTYLT